MNAEDAEERLRDYLLHGIATDVFWADEAYALAEEIGQHVEQIRAAGFNALFGTLQVGLSDRQTLSVTKMFDRPSRYPTRSIPATLDLLRTHAEIWRVPQCHVLQQALIGAGAESTRVERLSKAELTRAMVRHYEGTLANLNPILTMLRQSRDKVIAHNEAINRSVMAKPTWGGAIELVKYAKDFISKIGFGYLNIYFGEGSGGYNPTHDARRTKMELRRLLKAANIARSS